jgi:hypothetical protein
MCVVAQGVVGEVKADVVGELQAADGAGIPRWMSILIIILILILIILG